MITSCIADGDDVKKVNLFEIYEFGSKIEAIAQIPDGSPMIAGRFVLWHAREHLEMMISTEAPLLSSSNRAARGLITEITNLVNKDIHIFLKQTESGNFDWRLASVKAAATTMVSVLSNDMPDIASYVVKQKGIYRTADLIEHAERQLSSIAQSSLPSQACVDIREAGKCLAYELPTACAFHLWRAVETVMGHYYKNLTGKTFEAAKITPNWAIKIKALEAAKAETKITAFLDHIRGEYRNPQTHPDETVSIEAAQQLFSVALSSIEQIMTEAGKLPLVPNVISAPPALALAAGASSP